MSDTSKLFIESPVASPVSRQISPVRLFLSLALSIFLAEIVSMFILYYIKVPNYLINTLLDAAIMLALIFPGLYVLQLRPILTKVKEQEKAEIALRTNEANLKKILESLPVGVWIIDKNGLILHGNPAGQEIWAGIRYVGANGYGEYKSRWANTGEVVKPEEWGASRALNRGATSKDEEINIEAFDGTQKVILNSAVPLYDENNAIQGAVVVNQDITLRRQMENESARTNALMNRFFNSIHTMIAYLDRDFNFIRVNQAYADGAGHPIEYFPGKNHFVLYPHAENEAIFRQVVETGQPFIVYEKAFEYPEFPERGVTYWDWSLQPVMGQDGRVEGLVFSLIDVTRRKLAELQLERQNQELRQLSETEHRQRVLAETLKAAAQALSQSLNLNYVIQTLLDHIHLIFPSDTLGLTWMEGEERWTTRALRGYNAWADQQNIPTVPLEEISGTQDILNAQKTIIVENKALEAGQPEERAEAHIRSWAILPILINGKPIGFVEIGQAGANFIPAEQLQWVEALILEASVAIQNAWLFEQVQSSSIRLQSLARKLVELQEKERYHIARELHDEAGQVLSLLKLNLAQLEEDPKCPDRIRRRLRDFMNITDTVLEDLHRLAMDLRPVALDHLGLIPALQQLANAVNCEGLSVKMKALGMDVGRLSPDVETALYRIIQEALTNILNHAHASSVGILLERREGKIKLFVEDDGIGFAPHQVEPNDQLGLVGMRERAEMLGGTLTIESSLGNGTSIIVEVPDGDADPDHR